MHVRALAGPLAAASLTACSLGDPSAEPCTTGFLGSKSGPPMIEVIEVQPDDSIVDAVDGGPIAIMAPPQGGRVIFAGIRATNVDGCGLQLTGAIRDPSSKQVKFDSRTVDLTATTGGWGASGVGTVSDRISDFANIPVCPNQTFDTDVYGHPYSLEMSLVDRGGRTASTTLVVTPYCSDTGPGTAAYCACICAAHYSSTETCPAGDGG